MPKQFLQTEDLLAMLNEYAPHKVVMQVHATGALGPNPDFLLVGVDFSEKSVLTSLKGGSTQRWQATEVQPVLYSLADLPYLPGGDTYIAAPVAAIIHALNFIQRGDYGSGEWVNQVTVKSADDSQLHLAFSTTLQYEPGTYDDDAEEFYMNPDNFVGADYEVIISATGTVHWRNVTADELDTENLSRQHWRICEGVNVFEAFTMMRRLHVAVGLMAYVHHVYNGKDYDKHYSYVRKQLSAPAQQEGGQDA